MAINIERLKELIKANGFTAEILGIAPRIETIRDTELIRQMRQFIVGMEIEPEQARENFSEKYWEDLGIQKKKYKVVKVRMEKTIYKDIYVAMPEDEDTDNVDNYIESLYNLDNDYPDDEEDWEINDYEVDEDNMTADDVNERGQDEIWNYNDFED
jgi:hypothetical protein